MKTTEENFQFQNDKKKYQIQNTNNFILYQKFKCLISEPYKYFTVQFIIIIGMSYFYALSFSVQQTIPAINYLVIGFHILVFIFSIALGLTNPGIIPKIHQQFQAGSKIPIPFDLDCKPAINQQPKQFLFTLKSHFIRVRFCTQCLVFKPPRSVHCWICNACIQKMDHHCPFIGNCIGKNNYHLFIGYTISINLLILLVMAQMIIILVHQFEKIEQQSWKEPPLYLAFVFVIFCLAVQIFVGSLLIFHIYLIFNNLTTNEMCKKTWNTISGNPFSKNFCIKNVLWFIKGPKSQKIHRKQFEKQIRARKKQKTQQYLTSYQEEDGENQVQANYSSQIEQQAQVTNGNESGKFDKEKEQKGMKTREQKNTKNQRRLKQNERMKQMEVVAQHTEKILIKSGRKNKMNGLDL